MYVWFPLLQPPSLILESQIPPTMKTIIKFIASSYISWILILSLMIFLVLLYFVDSFTGLEFMLSFLGLWIACGLVVAYLKDMQFIHIFKIFANMLHIYTNPFHLFLTTTQCSEINSFTGLELGLVSIPNKEFRKGSTLAEYGQS